MSDSLNLDSNLVAGPAAAVVCYQCVASPGYVLQMH